MENVDGPDGTSDPDRARRPRWVVASLSVGAVVVLVLAGLVVVGLARPATAEASTGLLRLAHLSPTTPAVDMYVSGPDLPQTLAAHDVSYRALTPYLTEPAGTYRFQARPAGADPTSAPAIDVTVEIPAGSAQTAAFVDVGAGGAVQAQVLDDQTARAPAGHGLVRVVAAAAGLGPLQVDAVGGPPLARGLFYGSSTPYVDVPARPWTFRVQSGAGATGSVTVPVGDTGVASLVVTRAATGKLALQLVPDAASAVAVTGPGSPPAPPAAPGSAPTTAPAPSGTAAAPGPAPTGSPGSPPKAPRPPQGGVGSGGGGLALRSPLAVVSAWLWGDSDRPQAPLAPKWPEAAPLGATPTPAGPRPAGLDAPTAGIRSASPVDLRIDYQGHLQVPTDYGRVGWYVDSAVPGEPGPTVLVGHVDDRQGPAVFGQIDRLHPGDPVDVPRSDGRTAHYTVDAVLTFPKDEVPTDLVYGPSTAPTLRLITCGGAFDPATLSYRDNVVAFASFRSLDGG